MIDVHKGKATDVILEMTKQIITLCTTLLAAGVGFARFATNLQINLGLLKVTVICLFISILSAFFTFMATISTLAFKSPEISVAINSWVRIFAAIMVVAFIGVIFCLCLLLVSLI